MNEHRPDASSDEPDWPYASLLLFGFFGSNTPEGKRLVWQTMPALLVIVAAAWALLGIIPRLLPGAVLAGLIPAAVAFIFWANACYLGTLDELSRRIQVEAFAFTYGAVMVLAAAIVAVLLAVPDEAARFGHPAAYLVLLVLVEPLRGLALVVLARKYR